MKNRLDVNSLKFKLWTYFVLFAATIMTILWLLQIVFLNTYYKSMKTNEIKKIGDSLVVEYGKDDFEDIIYTISFSKGLIIQILNEDGVPIFPMNTSFDPRPPKFDFMESRKFIDKLEKEDQEKILYTTEDFRLGRPTIVYGAVLQGQNGENLYLYINGLLDPIDSTTFVLKNQLIIVTIISLLLSLGLSFIIASKISKPITQVTNAASVLAKGNYNIVFEKGDYTEIDNLVSTLNYTTKELSKVEELRRELISNVSHDLRTPLTLIKSYAEMIRDISGDNPEKRKSHVNVIIDESDRLTTLVNDILDLSKVEANLSQMNHEEFDVVGTTKDILKRFLILEEKEGFTFILNCDDEVKVCGDEKKIEQVIYNLISNAVNFTGDDKSVFINIKDVGSYIKYEVKDTGKGIPKEELDHIWDRYYMVGKNHKRAVIGTGLGLSIVKNILMAHNSDFGVESYTNQGTIFWFQLKANK
ncbi:HAMP domain-containing histidine kinase [Tissierella pigra]|uniref:sensor histidine kinase n=1 Tax=Tissierella pigra TaxID=2607614 RepID=UPI0018A6C539|nr:HAMP domain-containing sensor histidine kinase [Tissierella pigra]MBU5426043.1 HAMP domain-containing histidine kinase [Tissierella pigra]